MAMSISFGGYVLVDDCFEIPAVIRKASQEFLMPDFGTPEYTAWYNGEIDCANPDYIPNLNINLSNRNARLILIELGWDDESPAVPVDVFKSVVQAAIKRLGGSPEP